METSLCKNCGLLPVSAFYKHAKRGYQSLCKTCKANYNRGHYQANKRKYIETAKRNNKRKADKFFEVILAYLTDHPCAVCGEADPIVLEFHHEQGDKEFAIGRAVAVGVSLEHLYSEIAKCTVLCANDHKRIHAKLGNTRRFRIRSSTSDAKSE